MHYQMIIVCSDSFFFNSMSSIAVHLESGSVAVEQEAFAVQLPNVFTSPASSSYSRHS